ncbi:MAG TPA: zinc-dependent metalloprotease [Chitinophagaceae bacterium]|nr:MAG: lipoprotein [Bacteroidetes bacterium OLB11]HMN33125.1 zinc-dependent metalloprotease [Chitinophagaceae bacterium]
MKHYLLLFLLSLSLNSYSTDKINLSRDISKENVPSGNTFQYPQTIQSKFVEIDFSVLDENSIFHLDLFNGNFIEVKFAKFYEYKIGSNSWYAKSIHGVGDAIFSFLDGYVNGIVVDDFGKKYLFQQINKTNYFKISEVSVESLNESKDGSLDYIEVDSKNKKSRANANVCDIATTCPGNSVIDIMVLGTNNAIANGGGNVPAFVTNVTTAITQMNTAYTNSGGTNLTFNLVHCDNFVFTESADPGDDLASFAANPAVQALRDAHYADLVGLWVGSNSYAGVCGIGYLNTNPTNYSNSAAYTVTDYNCGMTNLTFAHECGHNMGLRHDRYVDNSSTPCAHHHGYTNATVIPGGIPVDGRWRTIMAYNNECVANGFNCTRLARWANPNLNYLGDPTGVAIGNPNSADEIYGFERFRCVVENFKIAPIPTPVHLISFNSSKINNDIHLTWETSQEENMNGYEVEMKTTLVSEFSKIQFVKSENNKSTTRYQYNLAHLNNGTYYFRLKMLDLDGKYQYSEIIKEEISSQSFSHLIYPNPVENEMTISLNSPISQNMKIAVYDLLGNKILDVYNQKIELGQTNIVVNTSGLSSGFYFCQFEGSMNKAQTKIIIK